MQTTRGDAQPDVPVSQLGGQGAFVKEVQVAVLEGRADVAVHSAKDLPSETPPGLALACTPERADPRDALVGSTLEGLAPGATVATGSVRRRAQLAWLRPDLTFCDLRGNMATRLARAEDVGAGVLALAALERLGIAGRVTEVLDPRTLLPQVGQGALAVECRADDDERARRSSPTSTTTWAHAAVRSERAFLGALGGGCTLPLGALAVAGDGDATSVDRGVPRQSRRPGPVAPPPERRLRRDPAELGGRLARVLLDERGGRSLDDWADPTGSSDAGRRPDDRLPGGRGPR